MYRLTKFSKTLTKSYGSRVGKSVKKERKRVDSGLLKRGRFTDVQIESTISDIPHPVPLSQIILERATKKGDVEFEGPAMYNQSEDEKLRVLKKTEKEMNAERGIFETPVEKFQETAQERFDRFKSQLNLEGDFEEFLEEISEPKGIEYVPETRIQVSKKLLPDYSTQEDHEFILYMKQPGANFHYLPDFSSMTMEEIKNSDPAYVPDDLSYPPETPEGTVESAREFFKRANSLLPGTYIQEQNPLYSYLYTTNPPFKFSNNDLFKVYIISEEEYKRWFPYGAGIVDKVWKKLCQRGVMVRPHILPVIDFIDDFIKGTHKKIGYLFSGVQGGGKSFLLFQAAHYALNKVQFITFHIPSLYEWLHGIHYIVPSPLLKGYYDAPLRTLNFIRSFRHQNCGFLRNIPLSTNYQFPIKKNTDFEKKGGLHTLDDLCAYGSVNEYLAVIALKILLDEIYFLKDFKVLFIIDDYNHSLEYSGFHFGDLMNMSEKDPERVHARQFVLVRGIERFMGSGKSNYAFICADSHTFKTETKWTLMHRNALCAINVQRYSYPEMNTITTYYQSCFFVWGTPRAFMEDFVWVTGGNPGKIWKKVQYI